MRRLTPTAPPDGASEAERLRYVREWAVIGAIGGIPVWAMALVFVDGDGVRVAFVAVALLTLLNIASLNRKIRRAEEGDRSS
jgi:hypothetical protein